MGDQLSVITEGDEKSFADYSAEAVGREDQGNGAMPWMIASNGERRAP
jgi:hypothetical protein